MRSATFTTITGKVVKPSQLSQTWFGRLGLRRQLISGVCELTAVSVTCIPLLQGHGDFVSDAQCSPLKPTPQLDFYLNIALLTADSLFFELFLPFTVF